jgi:thiamine-monophosphate kinase
VAPLAPTETVASAGERSLIERIRARAGSDPPHVLVGIGDDAAVLRPDRGSVLVVTTDILIEDVHFRRAWTAPRAIGHKALAVNLSDLAAMGAAPRSAQLSLGLPADLPLSVFDELVEGFLTLAREAGVALSGGNLSRSPGPLIVDTTLLGSALPRKLLTRSGARPGDELYLTGALGGAAAGLAWLSDGHARQSADEAVLAAIDRYERPEARYRCGLAIARSRAASAAIDLSDGLGEGALQMSEASGVGLELDATAVPVDAAMYRRAGEIGIDPVIAAIEGGEDYELLFAVPRRLRSRFLSGARRCRGLVVTPIGVVTRGSGVTLRRGDTVLPVPRGFRHFSA